MEDGEIITTSAVGVLIPKLNTSWYIRFQVRRIDVKIHESFWAVICGPPLPSCKKPSQAMFMRQSTFRVWFRRPSFVSCVLQGDYRSSMH